MNSIAQKENLNIKSIKLDIHSEKDRDLVKNLDIDVLINNAGIGDSGSVSEVDVDRYRNTFETNVFSAIELTQAVLRNMIKRGSGRVIFVSSLIGRITVPFLSPYTATKFALEAVGMSLRDEMKALKDKNIEVALIEPGAYHTGFNQKNVMKQFVWMKKDSYFKDQVDKLEKKQLKYFEKIEMKSTKSIVEQYVKAVEDKKAKERYIAPCYQGAFIQFQRIIGK